ncbi:FecR family protein [Mucilaginibacter sp. X4EP1]|uniref:FecR family protein n=1 Tax=Mucilaginibacter sp. X4EP1 TaxID=2723092 RepID=UPI002168E174|nr:FecR family protein [Mucilaginibacter sp. X4EP1]MCS3814201.1 ferric-dicitrate binding protein FerR (iron transport regulator) [Mucilaginibacter sp. X4EP1]
MDINQIKALLQKYSEGTCSVAEKEIIEQWLAESEISTPIDFSDDFITEQLLINKGKIDSRIGADYTVTVRKSTNWLAVAASALLFVSVSLVAYKFYFKKQPTGGLAANSRVEKRIINGWVYIQTSKGVTEHVKLPDGSLITLDASTAIRYPQKFSNHKRPVFLDEGEALFEVAKDKTSPFTVYTNKFATTALGTAFNIRSYAKEHKVSISLIHGKIKVEDLHPKTILNNTNILLPHEQIVLNKLSGKLVKSSFNDEAPVIAWRSGVLTFRNASMDEVVNSIENRFNVTIINNSKHTDWSYTGTFKDEQLADILKIVCLTEEISYTQNNNVVTLN